MLEDTLTCGYWTWLFFAGDEHYTVNLAVAVDTVIILGKAMSQYDKLRMLESVAALTRPRSWLSWRRDRCVELRSGRDVGGDPIRRIVPFPFCGKSQNDLRVVSVGV